MSELPKYLSLILLILSLCLVFYSGARHKAGLFLASVTFFMNDSILVSFIDLTKNIFGFGLIWPMIGLAGVLTWVFFKIPRKVGISCYAPNRVIQIAIVLSISYCLLSLPLFLFPIKSLRVILSFILSMYVGWNFLGGLMAKNPATIYKNILIILYTGAFIAAFHVILTLVLFNSKHPGFWNPVKTGLFFIDNPHSRFQLYLNALALGYGLVFLILIGINWIASTKPLSLRFLMLLVTAYLFYLLLNTGSRGPFLALCVLFFIFLVHVLLSKASPLRIKFISGTVLALAITLSVITWNPYIKPMLVARNIEASSREIPLVEAFKVSRINYLEDIISVAKEMGHKQFFGAGPGADHKIAGDLEHPNPVFESFFLGMYFNWGAIGGGLYVLGMAALSYQVIKMERIERARGNKHAWLATAWILIPWITSPFAYGFGIPGGSLCLTFAIGAGALKYCGLYSTASEECKQGKACRLSEGAASPN